MSIIRKVFPSLFYGWVIVAITFVVLLVANGIWGSFAVFYVAFIEEFGWSRGETAGIFSVYAAVLGLTAPVAGWLADRFGPRRLMPAGAVMLALGLIAASRITEAWQLYLVYGAIIAFGQNCVGFVPHLRLVSNWFYRLRGAAFGIATSGMGAGPLVLLPVSQFLILQFGWRQAYLTLACVVLLVAPLTALLYRQHPRDLGLLPDGISSDVFSDTDLSSKADGKPIPTPASFISASPLADIGLRKAASTPNFWAMFVSNVCFGIATIILVLQVAHIVEIGFGAMLAATISGLAWLFIALGRMLGGIFSDRIGKAATGLIGVFLLSLGIAAVITAGGVHESWLLFVYGLLFGIGWGFFGIVGAAITGHLFQGKNYGAIAGFLELAVGIGSFFGPWLGGYLFDRLGSYTVPFLIAVVAAWLGGICFKLAYWGIENTHR